tara:strand:- start:3674 stop:5197 length:1524 start_codon:yes stop_codon:yes gene_type:complete
MNKIVIVGGGTSGWITLAYLAATTNIDLIIIHSDEIDTLGVGESTTPTIKHVAETCGINEVDWMKKSKASFKYGIEFLNFNNIGSKWFHSFDDFIPSQCFSTPITEFGKSVYHKQSSSVEYFLHERLKNNKYNSDWFNASQGGSQFLVDKELSPYNNQGISNFNKFPGYSYHINAHEFGNSLRDNVPLDRYTEIKSTIKNVEYDEDGVKSLTLVDGSKINADLYIDCSGFNRLLIKKLTKFIPYDGLINNAAIWGSVKSQSYRPSTISVAQKYGWIWETPTWGQIGSGYVFCDDFISVEDAENFMIKYWQSKGYNWKPKRSVKFNSGSLDNVAVKNVISNGLGQSFIEPLEATSIMVICVTVKNISKLINKNKMWTNKESMIFSKVMKKFLNETMNYVLGHYTLSNRNDSEYWRSYNKSNSIKITSDMIESKLKNGWVHHGETNLNLYNWASMLVGYDKPYINKLPNLTRSQINDYKFYTQQLISNYNYLYKNNISIKDRLNYINSE